jgi:hypothetical protein
MKTIRILICFCLFIAAATMFAQQMENRQLMKVNIPFQFTVGERVFPAGEYEVTSVLPERSLRISSTEGNLAAFITVSPLYAQRPSGNDRLVFNRYGNSYFLEEVWTAGADVARTLARGKWEMEIASNHGKPESTTVLADSSRR